MHVYNSSLDKITIPLGLLGDSGTNATKSPTVETAYIVNNILKLLDICQSTILNEELSIINLTSGSKPNTDYFTEAPYFRPIFKISKYTTEQKKFYTMFNFQHSQTTLQEIEQLAELLLNYPMA